IKPISLSSELLRSFWAAICSLIYSALLSSSSLCFSDASSTSSLARSLSSSSLLASCSFCFSISSALDSDEGSDEGSAFAAPAIIPWPDDAPAAIERPWLPIIAGERFAVADTVSSSSPLAAALLVLLSSATISLSKEGLTTLSLEAPVPNDARFREALEVGCTEGNGFALLVSSVL